MSLNKSHIKRLSQLGHALKPIIIIGQKGLTEEVTEETERALNDHELIKVRISSADKAARAEIADALCKGLGCTLIKSIGNVIIIYRVSNIEKKQNNYV